MKPYITLAELRRFGPCQSGYRKLMAGIEYDKSCTPSNVHIPLDLIYKINGPADLHWLAGNINWYLMARQEDEDRLFNFRWGQWSDATDRSSAAREFLRRIKRNEGTGWFTFKKGKR